MRIIVVNASIEWQLIWNDEFTGNQLNFNEWEVVNETDHCNGNSLEQLQCHTSRPKNVNVKNGVLALTGYKEKYLNKEFTGARIGTKRGFSYVKVEIRASLPKGALLRPVIWMLPENRTQRWPLNGEIDMMAHGQTSLVTCGLHYFDRGNKYLGTEFNPQVLSKNPGTTLADYHIYRIEWTKKYIDWYFDDYLSYSVNIDKKFGDIYPNIGQPFDRNFRLYLQLGIGGIFFPENVLTDEDVSKWNCSLFIIDYIRIYKQIGDNSSEMSENFTQPYNFNTTSVNDMCMDIMPGVRPNLDKNRSSLQPKDITFITIIITIVIIAVIVSYFIVYRIKSLKSKLTKLSESDVYYNDSKSEKYDSLPNEYSEINFYDYKTAKDNACHQSSINNCDYTEILPPIDETTAIVNNEILILSSQ